MNRVRSSPGSSPPARGTPTARWVARLALRFIPACAGNTFDGIRFICRPTVHPRLRGEHLQPPPGHPSGVRFIPACAGNTESWSTGGRRRAVHPRLRGEHANWRPNSETVSGSSPPARGTLCDGFFRRAAGRFIPACAGNTVDQVGGRRPGAVHPRLRGEHPSGEAFGLVTNGSSPPARGTHHIPGGRNRPKRFIPACAGNTDRRCTSPMLIAGSSPPARGTHPWHRFQAPSPRFIPACAGNTIAARYQLGRFAGSSPPARGTLSGTGAPRLRRRFIPACAGNTAPAAGRASSCAVHPRLRGEHATI